MGIQTEVVSTMEYVTNFIFGIFEDVGDGFSWMIHEMDVTQWGILASVFVVSGFLALKTKI